MFRRSHHVNLIIVCYVCTTAAQGGMRSATLPPPRVSTVEDHVAQNMPIPGLVVTEGGHRYERARQMLASVGVVGVQLPAIFVNSSDSKCHGNNGHRLAMRNAWKLVAAARMPMAVFEDDFTLPPSVPPSAIRAGIVEAIQNASSTDILFLGQVGHFWGLHGMWMTPFAAAELLHATRRCILRPRVSVDGMVHYMCVAGRERGGLLCKLAGAEYVSPESVPKRGHLVAGLFWQMSGRERERLNITSYLHNVRLDGFMSSKTGKHHAASAAMGSGPKVASEAADESIDSFLDSLREPARRNVAPSFSHIHY